MTIQRLTVCPMFTATSSEVDFYFTEKISKEEVQQFVKEKISVYCVEFSHWWTPITVIETSKGEKG